MFWEAPGDICDITCNNAKKKFWTFGLSGSHIPPRSEIPPGDKEGMSFAPTITSFLLPCTFPVPELLSTTIALGFYLLS